MAPTVRYVILSVSALMIRASAFTTSHVEECFHLRAQILATVIHPPFPILAFYDAIHRSYCRGTSATPVCKMIAGRGCGIAGQRHEPKLEWV